MGKKLRDAISRGAFKPSYKLPAERDLAVQFEVSRSVVRVRLTLMELE
ncbi:GntR family transcriptional regulator [Sodalis-like endosymbiont of Proechinophthirus fluctus]|nr:GntR family transcriptional regulator [Sodalis-like endosymbiont of Proechinophthirus fluctus]